MINQDKINDLKDFLAYYKIHARQHYPFMCLLYDDYLGIDVPFSFMFSDEYKDLFHLVCDDFVTGDADVWFGLSVFPVQVRIQAIEKVIEYLETGKITKV